MIGESGFHFVQLSQKFAAIRGLVGALLVFHPRGDRFDAFDYPDDPLQAKFAFTFCVNLVNLVIACANRRIPTLVQRRKYAVSR